ncbi:hypothetical protein B0H10DRAFT_2120222, partial [Mycena sp. CBHHK59/15]
MHLHPGLVLKIVKYLPPASDMITYFGRLVDDAYGSGQHHLTPDMFPTDGEREKWAWEIVTAMKHERAVADFYGKTTAKSAVVAACTLTFHNSTTIDPAIEFTQTAPSPPSNGAISDGFLGLDRMAAEEGLSLEDMENIQILADEALCDPAFIIWEFKSLVAGTREVMMAIATIAFNEDPFPWEYCDNEKPCSNKAQHFNNDGAVRVTGDRMGFDADLMPLAFLRESQDESQDESQGESQCSELESWARGRNRPETKACYMLQQIWAQAVKHDTTFLVLHCGNYEFIGIRHRGTQTLYLSELLRPSMCGEFGGYYKIHVGLYMAAMKDAFERGRLIRRAETQSPSTLPESWTRSYTDTTEKPQAEKQAKLLPVPNTSDYKVRAFAR